MKANLTYFSLPINVIFVLFVCLYYFYIGANGNATIIFGVIYVHHYRSLLCLLWIEIKII